MTKLIPLDAAIDTLTELSCNDNAHWGAIIDTIRAIPVIDPAAIREAIARAWCHEENVAKEMDVDLAEAVLFQILALIGEKK